MHFEVGKKVICIKTHSRGIVKRGQVFPIIGIRSGVCACHAVLLNVGIASEGGFGENLNRCAPHGIVERGDGIWWLGGNLFAPYDDSLSEVTAEELIESLETQYA